jgi:hypothetical protein
VPGFDISGAVFPANLLCGDYLAAVKRADGRQASRLPVGLFANRGLEVLRLAEVNVLPSGVS